MVKLFNKRESTSSMQTLNQIVEEIKLWQESQLLKKPYAECSQIELKLALDNLESRLSPECISDDFFQTGRDPEILRQAIRKLWMQIETDYGVSKPMTHKW